MGIGNWGIHRSWCGIRASVSCRRIQSSLGSQTGGVTKNLAETLLQTHGIDTVVVPSDLQQVGFLEAIKTATDGLEIGLLVNNAGLGARGHILDSSCEELAATTRKLYATLKKWVA